MALSRSAGTPKSAPAFAKAASSWYGVRSASGRTSSATAGVWVVGSCSWGPQAARASAAARGANGVERVFMHTPGGEVGGTAGGECIFLGFIGRPFFHERLDFETFR